MRSQEGEDEKMGEGRKFLFRKSEEVGDMLG